MAIPAAPGHTAPTPLVAIDASAWISRLLPNDSNHTPASNWIVHHISTGGRFVAPVLIVVETAATLARITGNQNLARNSISQLYTLRSMRLLPIDQALVDEAADVAVGFSLRGADSLYVAVAKMLGIPLVTFDNEQLTRPTSIITTIKP